METPMVPYDPLRLSGPDSEGSGQNFRDNKPDFEFITKRTGLIGLFAALPLYFYLLPDVILPYPVSWLAYRFGLTDPDTFSLFYNIIFQVIMIVFLLILFRNVLKQSFAGLKSYTPGYFLECYGICYGAFFAANIVASLLTVLINGADSVSLNQQTIMNMTGTNPSAMAVMAILLGPVVEELIFRGIIYRQTRRFGKAAAILVSSVTFGLTHVMGSVLSGNPRELLLVLPYVIMGVSLSVIYESRRNLLFPIIVHMTQNTLAILVMILLK